MRKYYKYSYCSISNACHTLMGRPWVHCKDMTHTPTQIPTHFTKLEQIDFAPSHLKEEVDFPKTSKIIAFLTTKKCVTETR